MARLPGVQGVTRIANSSSIVSWHDRSFNCVLVATEPKYWTLLSFHPAYGRLYDDRDVTDRSRVCVLGRDLAREVFGSEQASLGKTLIISDNLYTVLGVLGGVRSADRSMASQQSLTLNAKEIEVYRKDKTSLNEQLVLAKELLADRTELAEERFGKGVAGGKMPKEGLIRAPSDGYVLWLNPALRQGAILPRETELVQVGTIDPMS